MNDVQENRLSMAKAVKALLTANSALLAAAAVTGANNLEACIKSIDSYTQQQVKNVTGEGKDKKTREAEAIDAAMDIIGPAKSYAKATGNNVLEAAIDYSRTDLERLRDTTLADTLILIANTVEPYVADLLPYEVTLAKITALRGLIEAYSDSLSNPGLATGEKSAATKALAKLFKQLTAILEQLDGLMAPKKKSNPDLYNKYTSSRVVGNKKFRPKAVPKKTGEG